MKFAMGEMTVGDILDRSLKLLLANLPSFYVINLIVLAPLIVLQLALPQVLEALEGAGPAAAQLAPLLGGFFLVLILTLILQPIGTAAILHIISQEFVDQRVSLGSALGFALSRFARLLGASILMGLVVGVGLLLCLVPGIIFWVWYIFVPQVVVVENLGGTSALNRSKELTSGFRWRVFGLIILIVIITIIIQGGVGLLEIVLPSYEQVPVEKAFGQKAFGPFDTGIRGVVIYRNYVINMVLGQLVGILVQTFQAVCFTLFYFDLRIRKEGFDLELAAREQLPPATF